MSEPNAFLTDERRAVLAGDYDGSESVERTHKSRIRQRARSAIEELIEVAQSPVIENSDVFSPSQIGTLLFWIMHDPAETTTPSGGLLGLGIHEDTEYSDDFIQYQRAVHSEVAQEIMKIDHPEQGRFDD
jgi:hypothetical protein